MSAISVDERFGGGKLCMVVAGDVPTLRPLHNEPSKELGNS